MRLRHVYDVQGGWAAMYPRHALTRLPRGFTYSTSPMCAVLHPRVAQPLCPYVKISRRAAPMSLCPYI